MKLPIREVRVTDAGNDIVLQVKRKFKRGVKWSRPAIIAKHSTRATRDEEVMAFLIAQGLVEKKSERPPGEGSKRMSGGAL